MLLEDFDNVGIKRNVPYYKNGRVAAVIKLSLPLFKGSNEAFSKRFNSFYEALSEVCLSKDLMKLISEKADTGAVIFELKSEILSSDKRGTEVLRTWYLRYGSRIKRGEELDVFDSVSGILLKKKLKNNSTEGKRI